MLFMRFERFAVCHRTNSHQIIISAMNFPLELSTLALTSDTTQSVGGPRLAYGMSLGWVGMTE